MRTATFLVFVFLFLYCPSFAQTYKQRGIIITNSDDTLHGWIDYEPWKENPGKIIFRMESWEKKSYQFGISDLKGFEVFGKDAYTRFVVKKEILPAYLQKYTSLFKPEEISVNDTVFLRRLVKGKVSLYELVEGIMTKYYIQKESGDLTELLYVPVSYTILNEHRKEIVITGYQYIISLLQFSQLYRNKDLNLLIKASGYYADDLTRVVQRINEIEGAPIAKVPRPVRKNVNWFIGASGGLTSLETYHDYSSDFIKTGIGNYIGINAGFNIVAREGMIRFQGMFSRAEYFAVTNPNEPQNRVRHSIQQYCFTPEASAFIGVVGNAKWRLFVGGGFQFPLVLLHREKLEPPGSSSKAKNFVFESLGWTVCQSSSVRINSRWEIGYTFTMPTIIHERETDIYYFPANYYTQLIYHFR